MLIFFIHIIDTIYMWIVFLLNRTEPNFWSGSGSVHQISVQALYVQVQFEFRYYMFGFGLGSKNNKVSRFKFGLSSEMVYKHNVI